MPGMGKRLLTSPGPEQQSAFGQEAEGLIDHKGPVTLVNASSPWPPDSKACLVGWHQKEHLSPYALTPELWPYAKQRDGKKSIIPPTPHHQ